MFSLCPLSALDYTMLSAIIVALAAVNQCYAAGSIAMYLQTPSPVEAAQGQTAMFSCRAQDALFILWTVNSHVPNSPGYDELEPEVVTDNEAAIWFSNLTLPAKDITDGARVVCIIASNFGLPNPQPVDHVLLRVQGTYEPVHDISLTNISYSVTVRWSPPPHLPSLPPTGYNITIINTTTEEVINQTTVSLTNYTFQLEPEHLCSILRIRVVAFSQLLGGQTANHVWSLGGSVEPNSIMEQLRYIDRDTLELLVIFKVAGYCLDQLVSIMLETSCDNSTITLSNTTDASNIDTMGVVSGPHELSIQELPEDSRCSYQITLFTVTNRTTPSQSMLYDTFDLARVQFSVQVANICVECCFINGSSAQGCHTEQRNFKNIFVRTFNASRVNGSLTTGTQCFESDPGDYTVIVYDINSDNTLSEDPYTSSLVIVPTPPLPTSTVVPTPNITGTLDTAAIIGAAVGGSVGLVLLIIIFVLIIVIAVLCCRYPNKVKRMIALDDVGFEIDDDTVVDFLLRKMGPEARNLSGTVGTYYFSIVKEEDLNSDEKKLIGEPWRIPFRTEASRL